MVSEARNSSSQNWQGGEASYGSLMEDTGDADDDANDIQVLTSQDGAENHRALFNPIVMASFASLHDDIFKLDSICMNGVCNSALSGNKLRCGLDRIWNSFDKLQMQITGATSFPCPPRTTTYAALMNSVG